MSNFFEIDEKISIMALQHEDSEMHNHDFLEMVYVTKGSAIHTLNDQEMVIEKGNYFIVDYGAFHKYSMINNKPFEIINVLFKPEIIDKTLIHCLNFQDLLNNYLIKFNYKSLSYSPTNVIFQDEDQSIYTLIHKLMSESKNKFPGYIELMRCFLIEIFIQTMRKINNDDTSVLYNDYSKYIIDYVDEHYMKPITLTDVSKKLNFSLPHICKKFKHDVGISFNEYLQKKRIEQSCRLLSNTDKKISEIAELVGYNDIKFFNQVFKKHLKMTPREFRKLYT